jgi:hypothetical protein
VQIVDTEYERRAWLLPRVARVARVARSAGSWSSNLSQQVCSLPTEKRTECDPRPSLTPGYAVLCLFETLRSRNGMKTSGTSFNSTWQSRVECNTSTRNFKLDPDSRPRCPRQQLIASNAINHFRSIRIVADTHQSFRPLIQAHRRPFPTRHAHAAACNLKRENDAILSSRPVTHWERLWPKPEALERVVVMTDCFTSKLSVMREHTPAESESSEGDVGNEELQDRPLTTLQPQRIRSGKPHKIEL